MKTPIRNLLAGKRGRIEALGPDATVADAVHLMNRQNIGAVLVLDPDGQLLGIFTERDVLRRVIDEHRDYDTTPLSDVMTRKVFCLTPDNTVEEALMLVNVHNCRHLPVREGEALVGMISIRDLTNSLVADREQEIAQLTGYIAGSYGGHG